MSSLEQHPHWKSVLQIQETLSKKGHRTLVAGGAVRDLLLERTPNDIDLATSATPAQVEEFFHKTVMVGRAFGVSRVILDGCDIEVATFRKDGVYLDGRKPESIEFSSEKEDALRRDFTINGMFYDPLNSEVIDFVGGQKDLMKNIIRTIGDPAKRFAEDKLRILRGLRFHGQLGFEIETKTFEAIKNHSNQIHQVSTERLREEWQKILVSDFAMNAFYKTYDSGLFVHLFPNFRFQPAEYKKYWSQPIKSVDKAWTLWLLLHNKVSIEQLGEEALRWKLPKKFIQKMIYCFQSIPQLKNIARVEPIDIALYLNKPHSDFAVSIFKEVYPEAINNTWHEKMKKAENYFVDGALPALLVNGDDLIQFGIAPGPKVAKGLRDLYKIQIKDNVTNKEELLKSLTQS